MLAGARDSVNRSVTFRQLGWEEETGPEVVGGGPGLFNDGGRVERGGRENKEEGREGVGMKNQNSLLS